MSCCIDDQPTIWSECWRKARKSHTCCECAKTIPVGAEYQYVDSLFDGDWYSYHTCERCADLRASLGNVTCPLMRGLWEAYSEYLRDMGLDQRAIP